MQYVSTRGQAPALGFCDVLMAGLASDGGLYVPEAWPHLASDEIAGLAGLPYAEAAVRIISPYVAGEIATGDLEAMCSAAYATFRRTEVAPLRQLGPNRYVLELFHGPTFAFKDVAMQLLARLMDHVLALRGRRITIVGATSGDTGASAIEAYRDRDNVDVFILFPMGRISDVQRRQMTTTGAANIHAVAVEGTFDDCQAMVKALFGNERLRRELSLAGVNSINWARVLGQIVYYFTAAVALGAPERSVSFTVPTGNFGDIFAGYAAKRMGLPVDRLVIATNVNDILARALATGRYEVRTVMPSASPSMDIQVSSNFERLLFEASGRDAGAVRALMADLAATGSFEIAPATLAAIRADFAAGSADEDETRRTIATTWKDTGFLPDPHTAVGLAVAERFAKPGTPMVTLSTADPAKFPDAVSAAIGEPPPVPDALAALAGRPERYATLPNALAAVERYVADRSRAGAAVEGSAA